MMAPSSKRSLCAALALLLATLFVPQSAFAYIGPGAGFAFIGSASIFIVTIGLAILTIFAWPFQWLWRRARGFGIPKNARARRVVVLGLDGLEPKLLDQYLAKGDLPNFKKLSEEGVYERLGTTLPALSPVAWSSFQTGVNPGAHNIFDFLTRDKRYCLPELSSTEIVKRKRRIPLIGLRIPFEIPEIRIRRKSQPFWKILGRHGIFSNIIRVPVSYPAEPFWGNSLSAMCTPDLRGTQGTFSVFTTRSLESALNDVGELHSAEATGGERYPVKREGNRLHGALIGPPHPSGKGAATCPFTVELSGESALLKVDGTTVPLKLNEFSPWTTVSFKLGRKKVKGICRFCLRASSPDFVLYVSPINIHPEEPAVPIAHPIFFARWLAKRQGLFGTLGLMEDTWGRNEQALNDDLFLDQTWLTHQEREAMFFSALERTRTGLCVGVFDASDRIQHMFWRYLDRQHPAPCESSDRAKQAIPEMYRRMDDLLGRVRAKLGEDDILFVISDHGFASFRRCINLNTWLMQNGYLTLKSEGLSGRDYFRDVDWEKTRAFAVGLSGLYINRVGRERFGTVAESDADRLKAEIAAKLTGLRDPKDGAVAIKKVYDTAHEYRGLFSDEAPDLIVGYNPGYRVSWESVTGGIETDIFCDNLKAWSGDHHVNPEDIPGIFLSNRALKASKPHIVDLAPSILDLFSVPVPRYMEGKALI